ncbi:MAG: hypothetical protein QOI55_2341, partial [Actinomycetota bacterium]|nr:hypothetical protein [Actinomycetota bacterium]
VGEGTTFVIRLPLALATDEMVTS